MNVPLPHPTADSAPFWEGCHEKELRLQRCARCGHYRFPPAPLCPECWSPDARWERVDGRAAVVTHVTFRRVYHAAFAALVPYVVAVVEFSHLKGAPRMVTRLVAVNADAVGAGVQVEPVFEPASDEVTLPLFRPAR